MELTRFLTTEWWISVFSLSIERPYRRQVHGNLLSSTFTGYIMFIVAIWTLSFCCCVIGYTWPKSHAKQWSAICTGYLLSILATRRQISSLLFNHTKTLALTDSVWVKKMLYYSNINYLCTLSLWKSGDLSPPGCVQHLKLNGGGVKLWGFTDRFSLRIQWHYEVLLTSSF